MSQFRKEVNSLLSKIKCGDELKRAELFDTTYNYLKVIACRYAVDKNDWQDILIETYWRAFRYIANFDMTKDGYNWLCKIVQNVAYDFNRKIEQYESLDTVKNKESFFNEDRIVNNSMLLTELSKLSPYEQSILYLRFWENFSFSEIAKELNGKKSTIQKQLTSLLIKLNIKLR